MRPQILLSWYMSSLLLLGCVTTAPSSTVKFGNFLINVPAQHQTKLASEVAQQLQTLYPPASTRLNMLNPADDTFGLQLITLLRNQGYAFEQRTSPSIATTSKASASASLNSSPSASTPFTYTLDEISSPQSYRVTLKLGSQVLTRAYSVHGDTVLAISAWAHKE